jgi:hypothetical protein
MCRLVNEALRELDVELDLPVIVVDRYGPNGPADPRTKAWATRLEGVFLCRDQLDLDDGDLRQLVFEEVAHYWDQKTYPAVRSTLHAELFATWFVARTCRRVMVRKHLDATDRYGLGRHAGAALAGHAESREELVAAGADALLRMVDRLDGDAHPQELAAQLAEAAGAP